MPERAQRACWCGKVQPCPDHRKRAWGGTSQAERTGRPGLDQATRMRVLRRDFYTCQVEGCGVRSVSNVDHILARAEGGGDEDHNLRAICGFHHSRKSGQEGARARQRGA